MITSFGHGTAKPAVRSLERKMRPGKSNNASSAPADSHSRQQGEEVMKNMSQVMRDVPPATDGVSFRTIIGRVAAILLGNAGNDAARKSGLSQREMALLTETSWEQVNKSLRYLHEKGAIRIDRHRIIVREPSLRKIAGGCCS